LRARLWLPPAARDVPQGLLDRVANTCPVHQSLAPSVDRVIELIWE